MKKLLFLFLATCFVTQVFAQTNIPQSVNFQAVVRDDVGTLLTNTSIQVRLTIYDENPQATGNPIWCELYQRTTNAYGSFSVRLNEGPLASNCNGASLAFEDIPWEDGNMWLRIEFQDTIATPFELLGDIQIASAFYALACETCENLTSIDLTNIQQGDILVWDDTQQQLVSKTLAAGADISVSMSTDSVIITNASPDQPVTLTSPDGSIDISGTYPNFTIQTTGTVPVGTVVAFAGDTSQIPAGWILCDGRSLQNTAYPDLYTAIDAYWGTTNPGTNFNVPDLRGQFLRGADLGTGNDPDAATRAPEGIGQPSDVGSYQDDEFESHDHSVDPPSTTTSVNGNHTHPYTLNKAEDPYTGQSNKIGTGAPAGASGYTSTNGLTINSAGDHSHTVDVAAFNSATTGGAETRPKNAYVHYIIKAEK